MSKGVSFLSKKTRKDLVESLVDSHIQNGSDVDDLAEVYTNGFEGFDTMSDIRLIEEYHSYFLEGSEEAEEDDDIYKKALADLDKYRKVLK